METEEVLQKLGLAGREAKVYLACLAVGESSVALIAEKAGIPRTHCYDVIRSLAEKGLVTSVQRHNRYRYSAVSPQQVRRIFANRLNAFEASLPELEALYQGASDRPKVRYFVGKEGLKAIHNEALEEAKEVDFYGSAQDWVKNFPDWYDFTQALIRHRIKIRDLVRDLPETRKYGKLYTSDRHQMRFISDGWNFPSDCAIWGNKVAFLTYGEDMHGVVVESNAISASQRQVFELLWGIAKP